MTLVHELGEPSSNDNILQGAKKATKAIETGLRVAKPVVAAVATGGTMGAASIGKSAVKAIGEAAKDTIIDKACNSAIEATESETLQSNKERIKNGAETLAQQRIDKTGGGEKINGATGKIDVRLPGGMGSRLETPKRGPGRLPGPFEEREWVPERLPEIPDGHFDGPEHVPEKIPGPFGIPERVPERLPELSKLPIGEAESSPEKQPELSENPDWVPERLPESPLGRFETSRHVPEALSEIIGQRNWVPERLPTELEGRPLMEGFWRRGPEGQRLELDDNGHVYAVDGKLLPNMHYELNGFKYETDSHGRIARVTGVVQMNENQRPNMPELKNRDKRPDDHRGHIIAHQLGGSSDIGNLVPQNEKLNQGEYKKLEHELAALKKEGYEVTIEVDLVYKGNSDRPDSFRVKYTVNGETYVRVFNNGPIQNGVQA